MDSTKAVTHVGLCAGYGGIELGLKRVVPNLRSVALCEIEAFAIANLVAKMEAGLMDPAPIWPDLKTFPWGSFRGGVDILTGGYPCQPFSAAGKRAGKDDPRHLWPWIADGIAAMRPRLCFFENVEGHISLGLRDVIEDLGRLGYRTTWGIFSASEVGAPHQRKRVFILAHCNSAGLEGWHSTILRKCPGELSASQSSPCWPSRPGQPQHEWEPPRTVKAVGDTEGRKDDGRESRNMGRETKERRRLDDAADGTGQAVGHAVCIESKRNGDARELEQAPSLEQGEASEWEWVGNSAGNSNSAMADTACRTWGKVPRTNERPIPQGNEREDGNQQRETQPPLGGDAYGASSRLDHAELYVAGDNRTDELRLLGNGVVPATAEIAFRTLFAELLNPL